MKKGWLIALMVSFSLEFGWADILSYWDFGADGDTYTEAAALYQPSGAPTFSLVAHGSSVKDANGKNGTAYTDPGGVLHSAGQAAAIEQAYTSATAAIELQIAFNGKGYRLTGWRWDACTDDSGATQGPNTFDLSYSVNGGASWVVIANDVAFKAAGGKADYYSYAYDLSGYGALSNAASVRLRMSDFRQGTGGGFAVDNMLVSGVTVGQPELTFTPDVQTYYVRPGDAVRFTVTASEQHGDTVSLAASRLPPGAVFTNRSGAAPLRSEFYWIAATSGLYGATFTASDRNGSDTRHVQLYVMRERCSLMLNEMNAVNATSALSTADAAFASAPGNGGNWMELMVVEDHLDLRGWQLQWAQTGDASGLLQDYWYGNASVQQGIITFARHEALADVRSGTLITIIETAVPLRGGGTAGTDLSFAPASGDWHLNICSSEEALSGGRFVSTKSNNSAKPGDFCTGAGNWQMRILDANGIMVAPPVGEGVNGCTQSVGKAEVLALDDAFDSEMRTAEEYKDRDFSSFGALNRVSGDSAAVQDARRLRGWGLFTNSGQLVINEYNAVADAAYPGGADTNADDRLIGRVAGNGGPWMELVVTKDHLDLRGWKLVWSDASATGTLTFAQTNLWADLRLGSVITLSERANLVKENGNLLTQGSELSYAPESGDFWIHVSVGSETTKVQAVVTGTFSTSARQWEGTLFNASGTACFGPIGEAYLQGVSISSTECMRVRGAVTNVTTASFDDAVNSSFALPNAQGDSAGNQDWPALRSPVAVPPLLLNEYNSVRNLQYLGNAGSDAFFGRIPGNGGNWIEFVVTQDHLDLRGWRIQWAEQGDLSGEWNIWLGSTGIKQGEITFSNSDWLADLRRGAIMTLIETTQAETDMTFDPIRGDWWMNICSRGEAATANPMVTTVINVSGEKPGTFSVGHEEWLIRILDASGAVRFAVFGEDRTKTMSLTLDEAARREADNADSDWMNWDDATDSTFSRPNVWGSHTQDFSVLRNWYPGVRASDRDDDAMADTWENAAIGSTGARPCVDLDGDGFSNEEEYIAGTDPTNGASFFELGIPSGAAACSFYAASGRVYRLESAATLTGVWSVVASGLRATNETLTVPIPREAPSAFFRISGGLAP